MAEVVVVGGGIGGLAAATAVARRGHRVVVLERADRFAEIGAGIQIAPNGIHALDALGVGASVRATAVYIDELRFMDGTTDEHVVSMPLTEGYRARFGNPYVVAHRAELHASLLDACRSMPGVRLRVGCAAVGYEQDGARATVVLAGGERVTGDAVIGADGIRSAIRRQLVGDGEPVVSGHTAYRALIPMADVPPELRWNAVTWWAGPGRHFVHYPINGGRTLNLAVIHEDGATEAVNGVPVGTPHVRRLFDGFGPTARRLLALGDDFRAWGLVDRDPVDTWVDGRVVLLGDAAHPMLHFAAQGACQGLEDAVVLGGLLDSGAEAFPERFRRYNAVRRERTADVQRVSRRSTVLWHPEGARARARNAALAALTPTELHDRVAWLHRAAVPAGAGTAVAR
ncbi:FAD-dependent monooxygenase [Saccharothrix sp. HUAS TT1]|uniref:FAD-dependent monooxygenase n=1 Tax=unclassified Saccharothrix TaxID=2593673 RepID=UPI00345BCF89